MSFRITSLKQLIVVSFTLVLIPLVVLLWHSNAMLSKMAESAASEPIFALSLARNINVLEGLMIDMERATRQYQVIQNEKSGQLVKSYFLRYRQAMKNLCGQVHGIQLCKNHTLDLNKLYLVYTLNERELNIALIQLRLSLVELKEGAGDELDLRLSQQQNHIEGVKSKQVWFTGILISISLLLALFSSRKILAPVQKLEVMIKELADKKHQLSAVSTSGPNELIELEQKLHRLAKRLNQLENLRKAMLRHAAHELKTPLASIKEGCSLLSEQVLGQLNPAQLEVLFLLNSSSERLESLVEQLLDYNMLLQQSQPQLAFFKGDLLLKSFTTDNQLALQQHQYHLDIDCQIDEIYADQILYRRILDNLLSNAIAHGTPNTTILIRIFNQENCQILQFANNGVEINPVDRKTYFQPFQRGSRPRQDRVSGSGLGLSIVSECAALMSGSACFIDVEYAEVCVQVTIDLPKGIA
ncbi:MAG: HAMP domain-containing sensor histidine kinase [Oceanospirillaceae bacterium]